MADIITAEERSEWKRIVEEYDKPDTNVVLEDYAGLAIREFPRTLAALEAAEAEIESLKEHVNVGILVVRKMESGLDEQRQRAEKAEAENARLRQLCGTLADEMDNTPVRLTDIQKVSSWVRFLRAAAEGKGTGT